MKYKSKFEEQVAKVLGKRVTYESDKLKYIQPEVERTYIPDWKIGDGVYIETKGKLTLDDRKKMVWIKEQYPQYKFYMLFQNAYNRITRRSNTTYADWCEKNEIQWAHYPEGIPEEWFKQGESIANQNSNRDRKRRRRVHSKSK